MSINTPATDRTINDLYRRIERAQTTAAGPGDTRIPGLVDRSAVKLLQKVDGLQAEYLVLARTLDS